MVEASYLLEVVASSLQVEQEASNHQEGLASFLEVQGVIHLEAVSSDPAEEVLFLQELNVSCLEEVEFEN